METMKLKKGMPAADVLIAITAATVVWKDRAFCQWAEKWLTGADRTADSARAAYVDVLSTKRLGRLPHGCAWESARAAAKAAWMFAGGETGIAPDSIELFIARALDFAKEAARETA